MAHGAGLDVLRRVAAGLHRVRRLDLEGVGLARRQPVP